MGLFVLRGEVTSMLYFFDERREEGTVLAFEERMLYDR
jgi:hypothetical protein